MPVFVEAYRDNRTSGTIVVDVPTGCNDPVALMATFESTLKFPYFGWNWNALLDCLRDLTWLEATRVVIAHQDIPLENSPHDQEAYLAALICAEAESIERIPHVSVVFPDFASDRVAIAVARVLGE